MSEDVRCTDGIERCPNCRTKGRISHNIGETGLNAHEYSCDNGNCRVSLYYVDAGTEPNTSEESDVK